MANEHCVMQLDSVNAPDRAAAAAARLLSLRHASVRFGLPAAAAAAAAAAVVVVASR